MGALLQFLLPIVFFTLVFSQNDLQEEFPPGWTEKCIGCMCEASSGCNQTLECIEQNEVKYCGVFLLSDVYWQDAGTPVLQGDDPTRIGAFERCVRDPYCAARAVNQYIQRYAKDCNRDRVLSCDDYVRLHYFGEANCERPITSLPNMVNRYDENEFLRTLGGVSSNNLLGKSTSSVRRHNKMSKCMGYNNIYRIVRREMLSRPMCRKLRPWPDPKLEGPFVISPAALKAKLTDRLEYLAMPKKENIYWESYYSPTIPSEKYKNKIKIISARLIELSQPKPLIDDVNEKIARTRFKNKTEWLAYLEKLKIFGAARRPPPSPLAPKRIKKPLKTIMTYLELLSQPVNRPSNTNEKTIEELNTIKSSALKYNASDRTKNLAVAKQLNDQTLMDLNYDPRDKLINAIKYIATDRIKELSTPKVRETPKIIEVKTDAFSVNPNALKAWCSPRIKRLAKPIIRN